MKIYGLKNRAKVNDLLEKSSQDIKSRLLKKTLLIPLRTLLQCIWDYKQTKF